MTLYFQNLLYSQEKIRAYLSDQTTDNTLEAPGYKLVQTVLLKVTNESTVIEIMGEKALSYTYNQCYYSQTQYKDILHTNMGSKTCI